MQDNRIIRYRQAAKLALNRAMTADEPKQWLQIAEAWETLAHYLEASRLPYWPDWRGVHEVTMTGAPRPTSSRRDVT